MQYDFDTLVDRENIGNMKDALTTPELSERGIIAFAGAEMDFKTAPVIIEALMDFASRGIYGYTLPDKPYLDAVRWWMGNARGFDVDEDEIVPTLGTMFALGTAIRAFTRPGDGVILLHPVYYRYESRITGNGRTIVSAPLAESEGVYALDRAALERKMGDPRNRLLVLCNPHNPLGKVFDRADLEFIGATARRHGVTVFSDEIFGEIGFEGHDVTPYADVDPGDAIVCTSLGKVFNLTGVNHANVIIRNRALREAYLTQRHTDHFGSIDPFFHTAVVAGYSPRGLDWVREMKAYVWQNYAFIRGFIAARLPALRVSPLEGGFIIWIDFRRLGLDDGRLASFLEREAFMIVDGGSEYGPQGSGFCRMNIASPTACIKKGMDSLYRACRRRGY